MKVEEKEYVFTMSRGIDDSRPIRVKEHELTQPQKDLLLGEVIWLYQNLPLELQNKFNEKIITKP